VWGPPGNPEDQASKAKAAAVARQPQPRFTDRDEALNQLTAAVAACLKAGLTDIPVLLNPCPLRRSSK
jgi:hypothetical protein